MSSLFKLHDNSCRRASGTTALCALPGRVLAAARVRDGSAARRETAFKQRKLRPLGHLAFTEADVRNTDEMNKRALQVAITVFA